MVFVALFYVFLWVLDLNGMTSLTPVLVVPAVLAVLVAFGVWLNNFMGITPRSPKFVEPDTATPSATPPTTERANATEVDAASNPGDASDATMPSLPTDPAASIPDRATAPEATPDSPAGATPRDPRSSDSPARHRVDPHGGPPA